MRTLTLLVAVAGIPLSVQPPPRSACLPYEPDTVQLTGRLERRVYDGAPSFGEDPAHDAQEVGFYLELAVPVCAASRHEPALDDPQRGVRRVQLVLDSVGYARLRPYLQQRVTLRGTLFAAQTGHHHTPILLDVATPVRPAQPERMR